MLRGNVGFVGLLLIAVLLLFGVNQTNVLIPKSVKPVPKQIIVRPDPSIPVPVRPNPDGMPQPVSAVELTEVYSNFCSACIKVEPVIKSVQAKGIKVHRINASEDPSKAVELKIKGTPTIIVYKDGIEVDRIEGYISESELLARIANAQLRFFLSPSIQAVRAEDDFTTVGENGWRLRVFYPPGGGDKITQLFINNPEFSAFGQQYGYLAYPTDDPRFEPWGDLGYATDRVTVVLVNPKNKVVLKTSSVDDTERLLNNLANAVSKPYWLRAGLVEP